MHPFRSGALCLTMVAVSWGAAVAAGPGMANGAPPRLLAAASGGGHEAHQHGGGEPGGRGSGHGGSMEAPASNAAAAWAELRNVRDAIAAEIDADHLGEIHAQSERLGPLAKAVLDASKDLTAEKRARVESAVKQVAKVAGMLHEAADGGNADATRRELKRLDGVLELIRAQYPPDALSSEVPGGRREDHAMRAHDHGGAGSAGHAHAERPLAAVDLPPLATIHVRAGEYSFEPRTLELRAGVPTRIELQNDGVIEHSLIVRTPDGAHDWVHLHAAAHGTDASTFELDRPGTYPVLCTIPGHKEAGMVGELVVVAK